MLEWDILSVYPYKEENVQEILCRIYSIVEELKKNGQVIDPEWIKKVEKQIADLEEFVKTQFDAKIQQALTELKSEVNKYQGKINQLSIAYPQGNIITDPMLNDYSQTLTLGEKFTNSNTGVHGSTTLHVKNGTGTVAGTIDINSTLYSDDPSSSDKKYKIVDQSWMNMKQARTKAFTMTGYSSGYNASGTYFCTLDNNGKITIDRQTYRGLSSSGSNGKYCPIELTFPIVKNYPMNDDYMSLMNAKIGAIETKTNEMTSTIVLASDTHMNNQYDPNETIGNYNVYMPMLLNYANSNIGAFATIINGDVFSEKSGVNPDLYDWLMLETRRQFIDNTYFVLGNHDDMSLHPSYPEQFISKERWQKFMNRGKTGINFAESDQPYAYTDDTVGQCRHIFLNSHDVDGKKIHSFEFSKNQIEWLVYALKTTPKNYSIVCYSHVSPRNSKDVLQHGNNDAMINGNAIHSILVAYKNRTKGSVPLAKPLGTNIEVDFTECEGFIAGCISGHEHEDYWNEIEGINYIIEQTAQYKDSFSIVCVDGKNRRLNVYRLAFNGGARNDIQIPY